MSQPEQGRSDENRVNGGEDPLDLIPQLSGRERRLAAILLSYSFTRDHVKKIIEHFRYKSSLYEFEPETVTESIKFWLKHVHPDQVYFVGLFRKTPGRGRSMPFEAFE